MLNQRGFVQSLVGLVERAGQEQEGGATFSGAPAPKVLLLLHWGSPVIYYHYYYHYCTTTTPTTTKTTSAPTPQVQGSSAQAVRSLCSVCHKLLMHSTTAMHDYSLLFTLAFR